MTAAMATTQAEHSTTPPRSSLAIISNSHTPYRLALHLRIAREMPEIQLFSLYTHAASNSNWQFSVPPEINPVQFGAQEDCGEADRPANILREWKRGGRIIHWLKANNIRLVVMMGYNDPGRLRIIRWCRRHGVPCFLFGDSNIHGDRATGWRAVVKRAVVTRVVRSCAGILACGSFGKTYFMKYGARPEQIFYFPYEPDYALIESVSQEQVKAACQRLGLAENRRRIVYSGRLVGVKRVDLAIRAFLAICSQRPEWDLLIIGDGPERERLAALVPQDLAARVGWTGFIDDQATVSALYRASDVLVLPSDFEPWALVINEAAAAGLALVCSNVVGAAAELVQENINGRLFAPGDVAALTSILSDVTRPGTIERMKAASHQVLYDWRTRADPVDGLRKAIRSVAVPRRT